MLTKSLRAVQDFTERKLFQGKASLAGGAGSSEVFAVPVPTNMLAVVRGLVRASVGSPGGAISVTVANGADTLTATAHGITVPTPCFVKGTGQPGGVTATTIYYAWPTNANTFQLYDTLANAVAHDGGTGLINISSDGSAVKLTPTTVEAVYQVLGTVANRNTNVALIGSPVIDPQEVISGWDCTVAADDTNKTLQVKVTPDAGVGYSPTKIEYLLEVYTFGLSAA